MLQDLRDKTHGWTTRIIFGLVFVAFVLWGTHGFLGSSNLSPDKPASVNNKDISIADINQAYQQLLQQQQAQLGANLKVTDQVEQQLKQLALQKVVTSTALAQSAEENKIRYTPEQVGRVMANISAFQENGHFSPKKFVQVLASMGLSQESFFNNIRSTMSINQMRMSMISSSFALPFEVDQVFALVNQKRDIVYTVLPIKSPSNKISISDAEVKNYYQQNQAQFTIPQIVTMQYLALNLPDVANKVVVTDDELSKYYKENYDATKGTFNEVKNSLRQTLIAQKAMQNFSDALDKLNNIAYTNPKSLDPAAKELDLPIQKSEPLTLKNKAHDLFANDQLKTAAFSASVLGGNNSMVINLDDQHSVVIHVLQNQPAHVKPLADVRDQIIALLETQRRQNELANHAQDLVSKIINGASLIDLAKQQGLPAFQQTNLGRFNSSANEAIYHAAFQLPRPIDKHPSAGMLELPTGDIAVIQVLKVITKPDGALEKVQRSVIADKIANAYAQLDYALYVNSVLAHSKISINNKASHS